MRATRRAITLALIVPLGGALPWLAPSAQAQGTAPNYPVKPIRYIVPFAPSGTGDVCARFHAQRLQERMGQPVVVDNRPGANQVIGIEAAAKAAPDGYTLLQGTLSGFVLNTVFTTLGGKQLPYDVARDFAPISMVCTTPFYLAVHSSVPAQSVKELVAYAKANPGKLSYSSNGVGSTQHLIMELFAGRMGIQLLHVPYKSGAQSTTDMVTGVVQLLFGGSLLLPHAKAGKVRVIATGGLKRTGATPDVPTMHEAGLPGFDVTAWFGLVAPTGAPRPIIERLHRETEAILRPGTAGHSNPDVEMMSSTPEELTERIRVEFQTWTKLIREVGIKSQ